MKNSYKGGVKHFHIYICFLLDEEYECKYRYYWMLKFICLFDMETNADIDSMDTNAKLDRWALQALKSKVLLYGKEIKLKTCQHCCLFTFET